MKTRITRTLIAGVVKTKGTKLFHAHRYHKAVDFGFNLKRQGLYFWLE